MSDSIQVLGRGGEGDTFLSTAQVIQGLLKLLAASKVAEAADIYSRCQEDVGYLLINKVENKEVQQRALANMLYRARDYNKAALCCENLGEFDKAATLYEQDDDYRSAGEMYAKVENFEKAAEMFERNQNYGQAAELYLRVKNFSRAAVNYEKAVDYFVAGKLYHELGKYRKSMELLQKVHSDHQDFITATTLIGDILAKNGYVDMAIKKILNVIKGDPISHETAGLYYHLAGFHQIKGNHQVAKNIYQQLHHFDISYRDVDDKLKDLGEKAPLLEAMGEDIELDLDFESELSDGEKRPSQIVGVMDGFDFLRKIQLFVDMPLSSMKAFFNICEERVFQPGEIVIEQDRPGLALYVIREGKVSVQRLEGEKTTDVTTLGPGDHVGEMSLVDEANTSARVIAQGLVRVFEVSRDSFLRFLQMDDKFAVRIFRVFVRTLSNRLRGTTAKLAQ
jgi:tetratricopeptide (TPR) repeat protein